MHSASAAFSAFQNRTGDSLATIVMVTDGTDTWYFSDRDMNLAEGHVHAVMRGHSGINESIDIYSKKWTVSSVSVTLHNVKFKQNSSGTWVSPSDILSGIRFNDAAIYLLKGEMVGSIDDCLLRFSGNVVDAPESSEREFKFTIVDKGRLYAGITLPQNVVSSVYPNAPEPDVSKKIPIVYGKFTKEYKSNDTGLAVAVKYNSKDRPSYLVSDHVLHLATAAFVQHPSLPEQTKLENPSLVEDDSGRGRITLKYYGDYWQTYHRGLTYLYPESTFSGNYEVGGYQDYITNFSAARDRGTADYASVFDATDGGTAGTDYQECWAYFTFGDYDSGDSQDNKIGWFTSDATVSVVTEAGASIHQDDFNTLDFRLYFNHSGTVDSYESLGSLLIGGRRSFTLGLASSPYWGTNIVWHPLTGHASATSDEALPAMFAIYGKTEQNSARITGSGDGTTNNQELLKVYDLRLQIRHYVKSGSWESAWCACEGYEYGSWINGRSSGYSSGDVIEDPAGIVEGLLRNELSVATASIDMPTFISAENASVTARINLHSDNEMSAAEAIQQIAEQSTFAFHWSASGMAKLVSLNDTSPTTDRTIPWCHIRERSIKTSHTDKIINHLTISSRWQEEYREYHDIDIVEDASSQAAPPTGTGEVFKYEADWPNIAGTSRAHVASHLVNTTNGIWSKEHLLLDLITVGTTNADLEIGDWIELDATSVDPHFKADGESWAGKQLLVYSLSQGMDSTRIKAIELYS